jgi:hypothetical protein
MSGRLHLPVILFFAALLALGLAIHRDYGISWDEPFQRFTGAVTVKHLAEKFAPSLVSGEAARLPALPATSTATTAPPSRRRPWHWRRCSASPTSATSSCCAIC